MKFRLTLAAAVAVSALSAPAMAQDSNVGLSAGNILVRGRVIGVVPTERTSGVMPAFPTEHPSISSSWVPEVDFTYMLTDNIGVEAIVGTSKHKVFGTTGTTGSIGKLASTWALPPTVTVQYHFNAKGAVRPYLGVGANMTLFYAEKASSGLEAAVGPTDVSMKTSFGLAGQAGVDIDITPRVFANLDVKWIDMDTTATLRTTAAGTQKVRANIDPLVFGIGIGTRF